MTPNEMQGWLKLIEQMGPVWGPVIAIAVAIVYAVAQRGKTPQENAAPVTRAEFHELETKVHSLQIDLAGIKGGLGLK